jgi:PAS domain S-box-containing protein
MSDGDTDYERLTHENDALRLRVAALEAERTSLVAASRVPSASEQRFRSLFMNLSAASCIDDIVYRDGRAVDYRIVDVNPAYEELIGISRSRAVGGLASELYGTGEAPFLETYARVAETGEPASFESYFAFLGVHLSVKVSSPAKGRFSTTFRDITERKIVAEREAKAQALLAEAQEAAQIGGFEFEVETADQSWTLETFRIMEVDITGGAPKFPEGVNFIALEYRPMAEEAMQRAVEHGEPYDQEWEVVTAKGNRKWVRAIGRPRREGGKVKSVGGSLQDITERKLAEQALFESERRLRAVYEESPLGYQSLDERGCLQDVNPCWLEMLGYTRDEVLGRWIGDFLVPDEAPLFRERFPKFTAAGITKSVEYTFRRKDGAPMITSIDGRVARGPDGVFRQTHCVLRDVTEAKRIEREHKRFEATARQQQKLESIGTLASGVAHEINNPLNIMMNFAELIQDEVTEEGNVTEYARSIVKESERVAVIVKSLLAFSRQENEEHSPARVLDLVERTLALTRTVLRKDQIDIVVEVPDGLPTIRCRSQQIQQVLLNLLTNARDALNLRYPATDVDKFLRVLAAPFERDGIRWVRLSVEDHGDGIPPEVQGRVFDPFFTTKSRDQGTGLGLSVSYGIVKAHRGDLTFETEAGVGTTFHIDLKGDNGWSVAHVDATTETKEK